MHLRFFFPPRIYCQEQNYRVKGYEHFYDSQYIIPNGESVVPNLQWQRLVFVHKKKETKIKHMKLESFIKQIS